MSRSGYSEDYDETFPNAGFLYQSNVDRSLKGARGQAFLREMADALDAMPEKRLIAEELERDGAVCAIGSVGAKRGIDMSKLNPDDPKSVGKTFGISEAMAREVVYQNDEDFRSWTKPETPEQRWSRMRAWVASQIRPEATS